MKGRIKYEKVRTENKKVREVRVGTKNTRKVGEQRARNIENKSDGVWSTRKYIDECESSRELEQ